MSTTEPEQTVVITIEVNGTTYTTEIDARRTLADHLRNDLGLTGTHLGCEHGVCGACTVEMDGRPVRSCLQLAVQADGASITTIEGLADADGQLSDLQQAFRSAHGFQCAFCAPGFLITAKLLLERNPSPSRADIRAALAGNLCRCTGYQSIVTAVEIAAGVTTS
jgi:carbon-monoxide dehydrogenase small subunit